MITVEAWRDRPKPEPQPKLLRAHHAGLKRRDYGIAALSIQSPEKAEVHRQKAKASVVFSCRNMPSILTCLGREL